MKESKLATFENVTFGADLNGGKLEKLSVMTKAADSTVMTAEEVIELRDWLKSITGDSVPQALLALPQALQMYPTGLRYETGDKVAGNAVPPGTPDLIPPVNAGLLKLEDRVTGPLAAAGQPKMTDAQSVSGRQSVDKILEKNGMVLEDMSGKLTKPIVVKIER